MSERMYARFLLFMNAVDDDLLEEALAAPKRKAMLHWKALTAAAACLCVVLGLLLWQGRIPAPPDNGVTAARTSSSPTAHRFQIPRCSSR